MVDLIIAVIAAISMALRIIATCVKRKYLSLSNSETRDFGTAWQDLRATIDGQDEHKNLCLKPPQSPVHKWSLG